MASNGRSKGSKERAADRRPKVLELKKAGATHRAIAKQLDISIGQVSHDLKAALANLKQTEEISAEEYRTLELERLDVAQLAIASLVKQGDLKAIDRWLRISEQRCKLLGLHAAAKVESRSEISGPNGDAIKTEAKQGLSIETINLIKSEILGIKE